MFIVLQLFLTLIFFLSFFAFRFTSKCWMRTTIHRWPSFPFTILPCRKIRRPVLVYCRFEPSIVTPRPNNSLFPSAAAIQRVIFSSTPVLVSFAHARSHSQAIVLIIRLTTTKIDSTTISIILTYWLKILTTNFPRYYNGSIALIRFISFYFG